ncbi:nonstructural protein [Blackfly microvirus SF02]|uniref:Nonstructural protein n=1 Tax=Blackfly microvirus SF02 TaxID=2576452 RepID=A0A4P8PJS5_9VIRU|nr:nonstructural protein [Blackfly microvirus SF02]
MRVFSVYDNGIGAYAAPFVLRSDNEAIRGFVLAVCDPRSQLLFQHPEDFTLMSIGSFDDVTADIVSWTPVKVCTGLEAKVRGASIPQSSPASLAVDAGEGEV